jgi:hypothetical protein
VKKRKYYLLIVMDFLKNPSSKKNPPEISGIVSVYYDIGG